MSTADQQRYNRERMRHALLLLLCACASVCAQKARPVEIALKDGEALVQGRLKGRQQMDYAVTASGETLTVAITMSPLRTLAIRIYDPDGGQMPMQRDGPSRWTATLSRPGGYGITVLRTNFRAPPSAYRLRVVVR